MKQIVLAMVFVLLAGAAAQAQSVPPLVNYQGMLTDAAGNPQTGTKKLEFNLYDAATGGNKVWGPQIFDSVPLVTGMFNVCLGTTDAGGKSITNAFAGENRYLGMKVDSGTELVPRQQILSTPFAINAQNAKNAENAGNATLLQNKTLDEIRTPDYDSGWFAENDSTHHLKTLTHNLGVLPSKVQVWFSEDNHPTGYILPVSLSTWNQSGGIQTFRVNTVQLEYFIWAGEGLAFWNNSSSDYKLYKTGFYRVLLWK